MSTRFLVGTAPALLAPEWLVAGEWIAKPDALQVFSVLKILAEKDGHTRCLCGGPQHCMPKAQSVILNSGKRS